MNTFVIEEFFVEDNNVCNFYTVRMEHRDISETDRFYDQFEKHNEYGEDFGMIHALIVSLAERGIQIIRRVRQESKALALPPKALFNDFQPYHFENKLRLYYIAISDNIVVLLGGGIAHDSTTGQPSIALWEAQRFTKKIEESMRDTILIKGNRLFPADDEDYIIIH